MVSCSCIAEKQYKFTIDYRDEDILYTDYSTWVTADGVVPSSEYEITIINKESNLETKITVGVGKTTLIAYKTLQASQACDIDGVYTFRVDNCGQTLERSEAILPTLHCAYTQLLLKQDKTEEDWQDVEKVFFELEFIKAASREELLEQASEHFIVLTKIIKQLNCSC